MIARRSLIIGALALFTLCGRAFAFDVPVNDGLVTDDANILTAEQEDVLRADLLSYEQQTSNQIAVLTVQTLDGMEPMEAAVEVGRSWGVGTEKDNGILILVSYEDRTVTIATGYGLEGAVPDLVAHGITEETIVPYFREGEFYEGIAAGIDDLKKHIGGEYTAERFEEGNGFSFGPWMFFLFFILVDWFAALLGRSKSWWLGGIIGGVLGIVLTILYSWWISIPVFVLLGSLFDYIVSKQGTRRGGRGNWRSGGWGGGLGGGGSSSGGGFGGFGGGSFGGGGSTSKW